MGLGVCSRGPYQTAGLLPHLKDLCDNRFVEPEPLLSEIRASASDGNPVATRPLNVPATSKQHAAAFASPPRRIHLPSDDRWSSGSSGMKYPHCTSLDLHSTCKNGLYPRMKSICAIMLATLEVQVSVIIETSA